MKVKQSLIYIRKSLYLTSNITERGVFSPSALCNKACRHPEGIRGCGRGSCTIMDETYDIIKLLWKSEIRCIAMEHICIINILLG